MKEMIAVQDLQAGMFVEELDRPWLGTPFLIEGFLIEDDEQLEQLRGCCSFVHVDRNRSTGTQWREPERAKAPERRAVEPGRQGNLVWHGRSGARGAVPDFLCLLRHFREGSMDSDTSQRAGGGLLARLAGLFGSSGEADPEDARELRPAQATEGRAEVYPVRTSVEQEMIAVAPAFYEARAVVERLIRDVESRTVPDLSQLTSTVSTLVQSVVRNPDALLWLTRLKRADEYAYNHAIDVSVHLAVFGRFIGLPPAAIEMLGTVGLMQDVGLVSLPAELLNKPGPLQPAEKKIFVEHVRHSIRILREECHLNEKVIETVARHHERIDGQGYPLGLIGEKIGIYAEMAGLVDTYCAMLSRRPYRSAVSTQAALEKINTLRNRKFSDAIVNQFVQCVGLYPIGTLVEMESGEIGVVIAQNRVRRLKPRLMLILGHDKKPLKHPATLNLLRDPVSRTGRPHAIRQALPPDAYGIDPQEYLLA